MPSFIPQPEIANIVDREINFYGQDFLVYQYANETRPDPYKQKAPSFAPTPVTVKGMVHFGKQDEMNAIAGAETQYEGFITISRLELLRKFPTAQPLDAITEKDEVGFKDSRWRIVAKHRLGEAHSVMNVLVLFFDFRKNKRRIP